MKKKIAFIGHRDQYFGAESVLFRIMELLRNQHVAEAIVVLPNSLQDGFSKKCYPIYSEQLIYAPYKLLDGCFFRSTLCFIYNSFAITKLAFYFRKQHIALVYTNTCVNILGPLLAMVLNKTHFWHFHEQPTQTKFKWISPVFYPLYRFLLRRKNNTTIFISNTQKILWEMEFGIQILQHKVIYTPPETKGAPAQILRDGAVLGKEERSLSASKIFSQTVTFGFLGSWTPSKNLALLLFSFAKLQGAHPKLPIRLILMGEGEEETNLNMLALKLGIQEQVIFMPHSFEVAPFFSILDVFVLPSLFESWGLVALEAIVARKALIMTVNSSLTEILTAGKDCLLINPLQENHLAADSLYSAMEQLLLNPSHRSSLEDHACSTLHQHQLQSRFETSLLSLFKQ